MEPVKQIEGRAIPFGRKNVDTDVIIPSRWLKTITRQGLGRGAFEALRADPDNIFDSAEFAGSPILIAGDNFGCGSSREHAPIALAAAGVVAVVAEFYARIFYRNSVNGGYLVPLESKTRLIERVCTGDQVVIDIAAGTLTNETSGETFELHPLGEVAPIIEAGGVFEYAKKVGMLPA